MLRIFGIALATLCIFTASFADEAAQAPRCQLKELDSLTLAPAPDGAPLVPASLQGQPVLMRLTLDNGPPVIYSDYADTLPKHSQSHSTVVGKAIWNETFRLGRIQFERMEFVIYKRTSLNGAAVVNGMPVIGALGATVFRHMDFELDLAHLSLKIFSQDHANDCGAYWADQYAENPIAFAQLGELTMVVKLDGKLLTAALDPSSEVSIMSTDVTKSLFGFDASSPGIQTDVSEDGNSKKFFRAMSLTSGNISAINTRVQLDEPPASYCSLVSGSQRKPADYISNCMGVHPLRIGRNILSRLHLYFATKESKVYYTVADASPGS